MKKIKIIFREDLNELEKDELRKHFSGHSFCLNNMIKDGFETYYYNMESLKKYWSKYAKEFVEIGE